MDGNCKYGNFECPFQEPPEDPLECRTCAELKNLEAQREAIELQKKSTKIQSISSMLTASQALPYEEKGLQEKILEKSKKIIEEWAEEE